MGKSEMENGVDAPDEMADGGLSVTEEAGSRARGVALSSKLLRELDALAYECGVEGADEMMTESCGGREEGIVGARGRVGAGELIGRGSGRMAPEAVLERWCDGVGEGVRGKGRNLPLNVELVDLCECYFAAEYSITDNHARR